MIQPHLALDDVCTTRTSLFEDYISRKQTSTESVKATQRSLNALVAKDRSAFLYCYAEMMLHRHTAQLLGSSDNACDAMSIGDALRQNVDIPIMSCNDLDLLHLLVIFSGGQEMSFRLMTDTIIESLSGASRLQDISFEYRDGQIWVTAL